MKLEIGKKYKTRQGETIEPIAILANPRWPMGTVACIVTMLDDTQEVLGYWIDGSFSFDGASNPSQLDAIEETPCPIKH